MPRARGIPPEHINRKGRPVGSVNKTTSTAKEVIAAVAEGLGGAAGMLAWTKKDPKNEAVFFSSIYPRLLPVQMTGDGGGPVKLTVTQEQAKVL